MGGGECKCKSYGIAEINEPAISKDSHHSSNHIELYNSEHQHLPMKELLSPSYIAIVRNNFIPLPQSS